MHIGAWQEYNLAAKVKQLQQNNIQLQQQPQQNSSIAIGPDRSDLEKAIYQSLDPEQAKLILQKLDPLWNKEKVLSKPPSPIQNINNDKLKLKLPQIIIPNSTNQQNHKIPVIPTQFSNGNPRQGRQLKRNIVNDVTRDISKFPPVYKISKENSINVSGSNTPSSVRSTASEPIQGTRIQMQSHLQNYQNNYGFKQEMISQSPRVDINNNQYHYHKKKNIQPPYNSSNMVSLLKLERNTRKKNPDYSKYFNKGNNNGENVNINETKSTKEQDLENRLTQVQKMQQLYADHLKPNQSKMINNSIESNSSLVKSPIRITHKDKVVPYIQPLEPLKINDMELTDNELNMISKYFDNATPNEKNQNLTKHLTNITLSKSKYDDSPSKSTKDLLLQSKETNILPNIEGLDMDDMSRIKKNNSSIKRGNNTPNSKRNIVIFTPDSTSKIVTDEDLFGESGGLDGLLNWTTTLDVDSY
jgi:hypothetical protein